jgi:hypothetical protein
MQPIIVWEKPIRDAITVQYDELPQNNELRQYFGQVENVYLARGNPNTGLTFIITTQAGNFAEKFEIQPQGIAEFINESMTVHKTYGTRVRDQIAQQPGQQQQQQLGVCYQIDEKSFLIVAIGNNGYIVTAYPTDRAHADNYAP